MRPLAPYISAGLVVVALVAPATVAGAASHSAAARTASSAVSISGVWQFSTNDPTIPSGTLILRQSGQKLRGHDGGGEPLLGTVTGQQMSFTVYGVSSEDDYGGSGTIGPRGFYISGSFWDGYGFTGTWSAHRIH